MQISKINRAKTSLFSTIGNRLSYQQNSLQKYIETPFSLENFEKQIKLKTKNYSKDNRRVLVEVVEKNFQNISITAKQKNNIESLKNESTFTITTGHQLSLFTGPLYFIYKILHVIKLTEELKLKYTNNNFVPVFWLASEDHDYEEIKTAHLFGKSINWETNQNGAVGRFLLDDFQKVHDDFLAFFGNAKYDEVKKIIEKYKGENLSKATFNLVHELFKDYGLIIIDGDQIELKKMLIPVLQEELKSSFSFHAVSNTNLELEKENIKLQVHPREINLFYLQDQKRDRVILNEDKQFIIDSKSFSLDQLLKLIEEQPQNFSPNVVLRPVYQETILPNLCYVGGAGEIAYWLQLKGVFDELQLTYPMIQVRNSLMNIDGGTLKKIEQLQFEINDFFNDVSILKKKYIQKNQDRDIDFTKLESLVREFENELISVSTKVDVSLKEYALAESVKLKKQLESIEGKIFKTEKQKHEIALKQIEGIYEKLFPNSGLQERKTNFFQLCSDGNVYDKLKNIYDCIEPFENDLIIYN